MLQAAIEWSKFVQVLWVAPLAGIGVTLFYSLIILGGARSADARRNGRGGAATLYLGLATVAGLVFAGGIVGGVLVIVGG